MAASDHQPGLAPGDLRPHLELGGEEVHHEVGGEASCMPETDSSNGSCSRRFPMETPTARVIRRRMKEYDLMTKPRPAYETRENSAKMA